MPQNIIQGVKVDGVIYKYDYESLENLPDPELPSATASDEGKALVVNHTGNPAWDTILPAYSSHDEGKVLVLVAADNSARPTWGSALPTSSTVGFALVIDSTRKPAWKDLKYPACGSQDRGKTLVVNTTGEPVWSTPSGALPTLGSHDEGKALVVNDSGRVAWAEVLPTCDTTDRGKVLRVNSTGNAAWSNMSDVLVCDNNDAGKALVVNPSGKPVWEELLPTHDTSYEGSDAGKVLTVATNGSLTWEEGGGGGSLPDASNASEGDVLIVGDCGSTLGWGSPFPYYDTIDDEGKVLTVTSSGLRWNSLS